MTAVTGRNGGVVFVKGAIYQDADGIASRNTNTLPITVMPWPGYTREQTLITKTSRVTNATPRNGGVEWNCNYVIFNNIQFDPDTVMRYTMGSNPLCVMGIDNCRGLGTLDGGLDIYGVPKGLVAAINGVNSQQMFSAAQGQKNWMRNSIWTGVSVTGITLGVNNTCYFGWDAVFFEATVSDVGFWNHKVKQTAKSVARFHYDEELTVAATPTLDAQGWTQIKVTASSSTLISNLFESYVKFLTGTLSAQPEYGKSTVTASWSFAGTAAGTCAIIAGALSGGFPNLDTVYIKGDLTASIAAGDKLRVYNYNHADSFQTASTAITTTSQTRNVYAQAYQAIGVEIQGMLLQSGSGAGLGTISTVGTAATLTTTQSLIAGQVIQLDSGTQRYEWALVVSGSGTSYVLDRAFSADQLAGNAITFRVGNTLTDLLWKNCVLDKTDGTTPQTQWQHGLKNATFLNTVFKGTNYASGSNNGMFFSTNSSANPFTASGFGLAGVNIRQSILHFLTASSQVTFATTFTPAKGINIDRNHFILGTVRGTNATGPLDPVFNATGEFGSGYKATAGGVQTVDTAHVKWDMRGNLRTVGAPVGPVSV
jgi:hypothetical protein